MQQLDFATAEAPAQNASEAGRGRFCSAPQTLETVRMISLTIPQASLQLPPQRERFAKPEFHYRLTRRHC